MKLLSLIPFVFSLASSAFASSWVVEFSSEPTPKQLKKLSQNVTVERFDNFNSDYFKRAFLVNSDKDVNQLRAILSKTINVETIEGISEVSALSITPAQKLERYESDDQLLRYQWGLVSQGQKVRRDQDDIRFVLLEDPAGIKQGTPDWLSLLGEHASSLPPEVLANLLATQKPSAVLAASDVNFVDFIKDADLSKEVTVAVIDSGIDLGHVELKNVIKKNLAECKEDGTTDFEVRDDRDDNGVPGDCLGWNFTVHKNDPRARLPMDDSGHGTHVAGIIAAQSDNAVGVSGMGANIKIVPIKVLHEDESSEEAKQIALTDRIARGILYAIKRNVDVINLSLGWLRQSDTKYLREAINAALARGIPVIAAAGNNGANARLFPCAYPGVICVGATSIDGKLADFSNHGGNVDIFAPGDNILSTWPVSLVPMDFSIHGYEIQSGTSQAAPFVAAAAAQLKAKYKDASVAQIQARLMLAATKDLARQGLAGRLDLAKSINVEAAPVIRPVFKSLDEISYTHSNRKFRFPLPFVNYWSKSEAVQITIRSESDGVKITNGEHQIKSFDEARTITLPVEGEVVDLESDRTIDLVVTIQIDGEKQEYRHTLNFVRLLINDPAVEERVVKFADKIKPIAIVQNDKVQPLVTTSESHYGTNVPEWFLRRNTDEGIELTFFEVNDDHIKETVTFNLPKAKRILGLMNVDFNNDGIDDRLLRSTAVNETGEEDAIIYSFRSKIGEYLYGEKLSDWRFTPEVVVANDTLAFVSAKLHAQVVAAPIFVAEGALPESQQPTSLFETRDEVLRTRIYILDPSIENDNVVLKTIAIDTKKNIEKWKKELGLRWSDPLRVSTLLAPTLAEHQAQTVRVLLHGGHANRRVDAVLTIKDKNTFNLERIDVGNIRTENQTAVRVSEINDQRFARHERTGFVGFYDGKRARTSVLGQEVVTQPYAISSQFDNYSGHVASFIRGEELTSVYTTQSRLILVKDDNGAKKVLERPLERFDFLPGQVFNELFWPIARENNRGELIPSLYVDASSIHSNAVHVIEARAEGFIAPIGQSVLLPPNCKALNPVILPNESAHRTTMVCVEKTRGFVFKFVK